MPRGGLISDSSGNLYGTTYYGGADNDGTVFEWAKGSGTIAVLASFTGANGAQPRGDLVMDSRGDLFGTADNGGANSDGTVFEVVKGSGAITPIVSFNVVSNAGVIIDGSGNLFGTEDGGADNNGAVFEVVNGSGVITTLASFNGANGEQPYGDLMLDSGGDLFGTMRGGGDTNYDGTVFEVAAGSGAVTTLGFFDGANGKNPQAGLVMDGSGNLYGITYSGGANDVGTVFEVTQGSGTITTLVSFSGASGADPPAPWSWTPAAICTEPPRVAA